MKAAFGLIGILVTAGIALFGYSYYLKQAAPEKGMVVTQEIDLTGVRMDLTTIAQAERMYFAQNSSYADLATLSSSGTMNIARTGRDGYVYSVEPSGNGFTATARYTAPPTPINSGATPPHFPTFTVDETMEVHQID